MTMVSGGTGPNATAHLSWAAASSGCEPHHDHDPATGTVANSALPVAGSFNPPGTLADDLNPVLPTQMLHAAHTVLKTYPLSDNHDGSYPGPTHKGCLRLSRTGNRRDRSSDSKMSLAQSGNSLLTIADLKLRVGPTYILPAGA
eukprot:1656290-Rhodomonas_salina.1